MWPCCVFYGRGCLYPSVLSAEMLLSSRKCLAWFDGRETWSVVALGPAACVD